MKATRVYLVEDHGFTRDGLRVAIGREADLEVVGEARSGEEALEQLASARPDVVVMDIGLPGMDGIEATQRVKASQPGMRVVMLTAHRLSNEVLAAMASGADAFCLKASDPASLLLAIRAAAMGSTYLDPEVAEVVLSRMAQPAEPGTNLTERELEVLRAVADGLSNREIAERLEVSVGTVKKHVQDILERLAASDRTQAAVKALRQGLL
ncbi:MAG TPA: response regulator transcription factor [Trueperaceae bacterium]|nr:response regulator transcription factor [Trueperaceae bacterium]